MASRPWRVALAGLLGLLVVGCGGDPDPPSTPASTAADTPAGTPADMDRYLLAADEIPGLKPVSAPFTHSDDPFELPAEGVELLERVGYVSTTYQPAEGDGQAGVSSVLLFATEAGARDWMAYEVSDEAIRAQLPDSRIKRFDLPDVPGGTGWTGPDLHGNAIGNVYWTQGRCMMLISLEVEGPRVEPLSTGAAAIFERTGGTCPE
jgi:hypothetical protein